MHGFYYVGKHNGGRLLDVGTGPAICHVVDASRYYSHIVLSEYIAKNRAHVQRWMRQDPKAEDCQAIFAYVAKLYPHG